jgi:hypothetical protein
MSNGSGLFSTQRAAKAHLLAGGGGLSGEIADVRKDALETFAPLAAISIDEYTNPATGGAADLEVATATTVAPRTVTTFLAPGIATLAAAPRNITLTTAGATPADAPATALVTGTYRGKAQTETITVAQTATIALGVKPFSTVTSVAYVLAQGVAATVSIGIGDSLGVSEVPKSRAGLVAPIREIAVGVAVTTGTLTVAGLYTPAAAPDGVKDYAVYYEYDGTL